MSDRPELLTTEEPSCPASREAVEEQEELGEVGCSICGRDARLHRRDLDTATKETQP